MVKFIVVCALCLLLALPAAAQDSQGPGAIFESAWNALISLFAEVIQPVDVAGGSATASTEPPMDEMYPSTVPNG